MTPNSAARPLILPVEQQVREFDAKLLMGCVSADRGVPAYVGFQNRIRNRITSLPRGIYVAKGYSATKATMMEIMRRLGHRIYGWDEEGLVHLPGPVYHEMRMGKGSMDRLDGIFSWGSEYRKLVETSPIYDKMTPIFDTGNPRTDLLRPELRSFYDPVVERIRAKYGRYILINSSFGLANMVMGEKMIETKRSATRSPATAEFWAKSVAYRTELFRAFFEMVGKLAAHFPETTVLLRPHPSENFNTWNELAAKHPNLHIELDGNVVPWLIGADIAVHNGCMTAIEGVLLGKTVFAYQPLTNDEYDRHLPNSISRQCFSLDELFDGVAPYTAQHNTSSTTRTGWPPIWSWTCWNRLPGATKTGDRGQTF
jgi:surface carbohydrate biosynthesis protein